METDFSSFIACSDGQRREFHFARVNSVAIYYHVSAFDNNAKLITATMALDENGQWRLHDTELPVWFKIAEPHLVDAVQLQAAR